jgi:hypothetical protein
MSDPVQPVTPIETRVTLSAIDISFGRMVMFFIKAALAAVPAAFAIMAIVMVIGIILRALFGFGHGGGYWHY